MMRFLLVITVALSASPCFGQIDVRVDALNGRIQFKWPGTAQKSYSISIDDSPDFRNPILVQKVAGTTAAIQFLDTGLLPGPQYYVRVEPGGIQRPFKVSAPQWPDQQLSAAYLDAAWNSAGRKWLEDHSGLKWNPVTKSWVAQPGLAEGDVAQSAYYLEYALRPAIAMAQDCQNKALLDELAAFFNAYQAKFTTLGQLRSLGSQDPVSTDFLKGQGASNARVLKSVSHSSNGDHVVECMLCNSQFLHPAARLIRIITTLPNAQRTPSMKTFVSSFVPLIVQDHLLRLLYEQERPGWGKRGLPTTLVPLWKAFLPGAAGTQQQKYKYPEDDMDLWLAGTAAEVLGANANDPNFVPLTADAKGKLLDAVQTEVAVFQSKRTLYKDTHDWQGKTVTSASYFNGDWADDPEMAYSGYEGEKFPTPADKKANPQASWDISHAYRIPVFLRSMYDNRKATKLSFPSAEDIRLVVNQFTYRSFRGNLSAPLFNNFFDGSNGWYRVGYHGPTFAYGPGQYCDQIHGESQCLDKNVAMGWGLLDSFSPDLDKLEHALAQLTLKTDSGTRTFRDRYYEKAFAFQDASGNTQYTAALLWLLGEVPERLQGCGASQQ